MEKRWLEAELAYILTSMSRRTLYTATNAALQSHEVPYRNECNELSNYLQIVVDCRLLPADVQSSEI